MVTVGTGPRVFGSGFDLKYWMAKPGNVELSVKTFHVLLSRILTCNVNTLCIMNGSAVAGGVFLALAHDHQVMKADPASRLFLNETSNGFPLPSGFIDLCLATTSGSVTRMMTNEVKLTPQDCKRLGIVSDLYQDNKDAERRIKAFTQEFTLNMKQRRALKGTKRGQYRRAI
jgi:Delta3-Delta2-enoyl-CoA isomerase